jgi:hypothetical protein
VLSGPALDSVELGELETVVAFRALSVKSHAMAARVSWGVGLMGNLTHWAPVFVPMRLWVQGWAHGITASLGPALDPTARS